MKEKVYEMSLGKLVEEMKGGWHFYRPHNVIRLGLMLDIIIPQEMRDEEVTVTFSSGFIGSAPNGRYIYRWDVKGVPLPTEDFTMVPIEDRVFGSHSLPFFRKTEEGFVIGYDW